MNFKKIYLAILLLIIATNSGFASRVGVYDDSIQFNGKYRSVSFIVPEDYDSTKSYPLVLALHGNGDWGARYNLKLKNILKWDHILPNTIFVCPDSGEEVRKDFYIPVGNEAIIDAALVYAKKQYNIDEKRVVMQGQSLGARSALKYGMDHPEKFSALVLHSPAFTTLYEVQNIPYFSLGNDYDRVKLIPIAICHGDLDEAFLYPIKALSDSISKRESWFRYFLVPGAHHNFPSNTVTKLMFQYVTAPIDSFKVKVYDIKVPVLNIDKKIAPICKISNWGVKNINTLDLEYDISGVKYQYSWSGNISTNGYAEIQLPEQEVGDGIFTVSVVVKKANGENVAPDELFNYAKCVFNHYSGSVKLPYQDDFSDSTKTANDWTINKSSYYVTWSRDTISGRNGLGCMLMLYTRLSYYNVGYKEGLITKPFDFSGTKTPVLSFDYAFNDAYYDYPYDDVKTLYTDTLALYYSNDKGNTYNLMFRRAGADLATYEKPFLQVLKMDTFLIPPKDYEWKTFEINLTNYHFTNQTLFKFDYISGRSGVIRIDNFKLYDKPDSKVEDNNEPGLTLSPNPVKRGNSMKLTLNQTEVCETPVRVRIYSIMGDLLKTFNIEAFKNNFEFTPDASFAPGAYYVEIEEFRGVIRKGFIVE